MTLAQGQPIRLAEPVSGEIAVKAILTGTANASPVLWPGVQILTGTVADTADYYSRSVPATGATKAVLIFDAIIPSGATVTPEIRMNDGEWESLAADGATQQGDGLVEFRFRKALDNVDEIKARLLLGGNSASRPVVRNIRMMAVI